MFTILICICSIITVICGDCNVIPRKVWGADIKPLHVEYLARPVKMVVIKHIKTPTCKSDEFCRKIVRTIEKQQLSNQGASFYVGGNGEVYEGAGWLHVGIQTVPTEYNYMSIGITFIGNTIVDDPTKEAMNPAKNLLKCGVDSGHLSPYYQLITQRQVATLDNPGTHLYNQIKTWPHYILDKSKILKKLLPRRSNMVLLENGIPDYSRKTMPNSDFY